MSNVVLGCRALLVGVFLISLLSKVRGKRAYADFRRSVVGWRVLSRRRSALAAAIAVAGEAAAVMLLALPWTRWVGFVVGAGLLAVFTIAIVMVLRRGQAATCRCFGASSTPLNPTHVIRNLGLSGVCVAGAIGAAVSSGRAPDLAGSALALATAAVALLFVVRFDDVVALLAPALSAAATEAVATEKD
jgi:hypothetical protein